MAASGGQLTDNPFEDVVANFSFGDAALIHLNSLNMNKARRLGWTGFVDTMEVSYFRFSRSHGIIRVVTNLLTIVLVSFRNVFRDFSTGHGPNIESRQGQSSGVKDWLAGWRL